MSITVTEVVNAFELLFVSFHQKNFKNFEIK